MTGDYLTTSNTLASGKKYVIEFWTKGNQPRIKLGSSTLPVSFALSRQSGSWAFYSITVTGTGQPLSLFPETSLTGSTWFDEVRLYPAGAIMNSYTYDRMTGNPLSVSDAQGKVTFYRYDFLGRLLTVTDEKGNILKNHTYQIQGPQ